MLPVFTLSVLLIAVLALSCLADSLSIRKRALSNTDSDSDNDNNNNKSQYHFRGPLISDSNGNNGPEEDNLKLLDIVLVASVDGKFHALNRTSGHTLWSMASSPTFPSSAPPTLGPLVRTNHPSINTDQDDDDETPNQELYIIEPQSGDIYVMATPASPLQRLPFSMSQLVDMSPFSFSSIDNSNTDRRIFVGRKETSLFSIELETGRVKEVNSECPWDPFEDLNQAKKDVDLDLDDLEDDQFEPGEPVVPVSTEISIGRTDYHITIHTRPTNPSHPKPPIQNLSFSTYGPNNRDTAIQAVYRRPADDAYIQSFPNGDVFAFKTATNSTPRSGTERPSIDPLWMNKFSAPIVAVFDVVQKQGGSGGSARSQPHSDPFVLLQPRPHLEAGLGLANLNSNPDANKAKTANNARDLESLPNAEKAYVGLVEESGSLFAMSPGRFPLVAFGGDVGQFDGYDYDYDYEWYGSGDEGTGVGVTSPLGVDAITARRKMREFCGEGKGKGKDRRCLLGKRPLVVKGRERMEGMEEEGWKSLLDGVPSVELPPSDGPFKFPGLDNAANAGTMGNSNTTWIREGDNDITLPKSSINTSLENSAAVYYGSAILFVLASWGLLALFVGAVSVYRKVRGGGLRSVGVLGSSVTMEVEKVGEGETSPALISSLVEKSDSSIASVPVPISAPPQSSSPSPTSSISDSYVVVAAEGGSRTGEEGGDVITSNKNDRISNEKDVTDGVGTTTGVDAAQPPVDEACDAEESDRDADGDAEAAGAGKRKGPKRKRRGKKKKAGAANGAGANGEDGEKEKVDEENPPAVGSPSAANLVIPLTPQKTEPAMSSSLVVSDTILGFGSHGTVVFKGSLQGRAVAVKRLLQDFVTLASREVSILRESDDHPNVIRYYYQEAHANFLYIALELCPASLADIIETPSQFPDIASVFDPKRALKQIASGLRHLHSLKLVHRDIKPQNILVSSAKKHINGNHTHGLGEGGGGGGHRMLISDFGLCKKLDVDQTSFLPTAHGAMAAGTVGWRAPEILRGEVKLDESVGDESQSSRGSVGTSTSGSSGSTSTLMGKPTRLTKLVDIFALGCLFYYTLTGGGHPYGDRFEREVNILKNVKNLEGLERFGEEGSDAAELISSMLSTDAADRPDTTSCLLHPFFWDHGRRLTFLQDASDRFEIMCRDPRDPHLVTLEKGAFDIVGNDWHSRLDKIFIENLGKFRKYDGKSVQDLLRALRNKKNHYQDLPENVKRHLGPMPEGFLSYFTRRFPRLFLHVHSVIANTSLRQESMFRSYFELAE